MVKDSVDKETREKYHKLNILDAFLSEATRNPSETYQEFMERKLFELPMILKAIGYVEVPVHPDHAERVLTVLSELKEYCESEIKHVLYMQDIIKDTTDENDYKRWNDAYKVEITTLKRMLNKISWLEPTQAYADLIKREWG